jgi:hypothetical protein
MERQAKDGTFYQQVGQDEWVPVTRKDKEGNVYKKVGEDAWAIITEDAPKGATAGDKGMATLEGFAKSSSMGTLPYLQAAGEVVTDKLAGAIYDAPQSDESYSDRVDRARKRSQGIKEKAPGYNLGGEIAGFLTPGMAISKGVGAAGKALGIVGAAKTAPLAARLASQSGRLATEGAIFGAAYTPDTGFSDIGARAEAAGTGAAFGALMPPAMYAGGKALSAAAKAPGWAGKKLLSSLGGVKEEVIERYLQNPERIRSAKTFDELYETTTKIVSQLGDDLDNAKIDFDSAKKHLDEVADGIKNSRIEGRDTALEQVNRAKILLDESFKNQKAGLQSKASASNVEPMVSDALTGLKKKVSAGSKEAVESLGDEAVSVSSSYDDLIKATKQLTERGSDSAGKAVSKLQQYGQLIFGKGQTGANGQIKLPAKEIKRIIQDLDNDISSWNLSGGAYDDAYNQSLKSLRKSLDEQLKLSNPAYKDKMAMVAEDAKLLGQASERFGKPDRALNRLGGLDRTSAKYDLETVKALAAKEGGDLTQAIDDMTKAQRTLKSPTRLEGVKRSLPEASALREAEMRAAAAKRLAKPNLVKEAIKKNAASFKLKSADQKLKAQKEVFNRLKSFGEQGAENKLQQVARGRKYAEKQLQELSKYADEDLVEAVKAAQDAAAFDKTMFSGSRNVNLWAMLGALGQSATGKGGVGAATGGVFAGPMGMAIGGTIGALMDNYGPRVTKQILDGVIKIKGPVSELAIMKMNVPDNVKSELAKQFRQTLVAERAANAAKSAGNKIAEEKPKGEEKWANDGFEKILNHTTDQEKIERYKKLKSEFLNSRKAKSILVRASDLKPGSKAMEDLIKQLETEGGN